MKKKVVITGGAGFIGSHIADRFLKNGSIVTIIDINKNPANISHIKKDIHYIEGNILDKNLLEKECRNAKYVIHHAAIPSVPKTIKDPKGTHETNVTGTLNVFLAALKAGAEKVIYASSSAVYGDAVPPHKEGKEGKLLSPYALHKQINEEHGAFFYNKYGLPVVGLRYFNVFGPRQNPESEYAAVIPKFIRKMTHGEKPVIYGDGNTMRDFVYIDNIVDAVMSACNKDNIMGEVFNIATGRKTSLVELVNAINTSLDTKIKPKFEDQREGDIKESFADIEKAQKELGYEVKVNFEDGIKKTIKSFLDK